MRGFLREKRASVAIEAAIALTVLVLGFGALMEIVRASYAEDRMGRAARAAARALALDPAADACAAIRGELRVADDFACSVQSSSAQSSSAQSNGISARVDRGVSPTTLPATLDAAATAGTGDMVLIRIGWNREPGTFSGLLRDANAANAANATTTVPMTAMGLARCELKLCRQESS